MTSGIAGHRSGRQTDWLRELEVYGFIQLSSLKLIGKSGDEKKTEATIRNPVRTLWWSATAGWNWIYWTWCRRQTRWLWSCWSDGGIEQWSGCDHHLKIKYTNMRIKTHYISEDKDENSMPKWEYKSIPISVYYGIQRCWISAYWFMKTLEKAHPGLETESKSQPSLEFQYGFDLKFESPNRGKISIRIRF